MRKLFSRRVSACRIIKCCHDVSQSNDINIIICRSIIKSRSAISTASQKNLQNALVGEKVGTGISIGTVVGADVRSTDGIGLESKEGNNVGEKVGKGVGLSRWEFRSFFFLSLHFVHQEENSDCEADTENDKE